METEDRGTITLMLVEDDAILSREIKAFFEKWDYIVRNVTCFDHVTKEYDRIHPQLILLDISLPCFDGFYWCRKIREYSQAPIVFISGRDDDRDKIMAITQGGDDYVEKPFRLEFLKAKVEAVLRRTYQYRVKDRIRLKEGLYFDQDTSSLICGSGVVELTRMEKKVLDCLVERRPGIVSREQLMTVLWDTDEFISDAALTTCISRLRSRLQEICKEPLIETKKGQGYYII